MQGKRYRPVFRHLRLGSKEYWVMDPKLAQERAALHLRKGLELLHESTSSEEKTTGCSELILATDFGCGEAPFLLALQILGNPSDPLLPRQDFLTFLRLAAERGNGRAAYRLASGYAKMGHFPAIESLAKAHFEALSTSDRVRLAEYYFAMAISEGHDEAIDELIVAYAYGRGLISKSLAKFQRLCEALVKQNKQSVMIGYGAWLCGMTVTGEPPLAGAIEVPKEVNRGLDYLFKASRGPKLSLAQHALKLILVAQARGMLGTASLQKLQHRLFKEAKENHQLLALYFAWYATPAGFRTEVPSFIAEEPLAQLQHFISANQDLAIKWLDIALFGADAALAEMAKLLLGNLFVREPKIAPTSKKVVSLASVKMSKC